MVVPRITRDAPRMGHRNADERIHELAAAQHGVVTRTQLLGAGVSAGAIDHRLKKGTLCALLDDTAGPALTRSEAETRFLALLRKAGVPRPRTNSVVCGLEVDFFWPDRDVVVEIDGFAYHSHRSAFENDRRRDRILASEGLTVIRVTWRQIQNEPEKLLARLCMTPGRPHVQGSDRGGQAQGRAGPVRVRES